MRAISQYPKYRIQVRPARVKPLGDGTSETLDEGLYLDFMGVDDGGMIYEKEVASAMEHFKFHGFQQHQDEATPVDPIHRLSVVDTDELAVALNWSADDKELVEKTLMGKSHTTPQAVLIMVQKPVEAPFPSYDAYDGEAEALVLRLVEDGFDLETVLRYESGFGPKRLDVIDALETGIEALQGLTVPA